MKIYNYIIIMYICIPFTGCKKLVEIDPPKDALITKVVFTTDETANSAILSIYSTMAGNSNSSSYFIPFMTGIYGDELNNNLPLAIDIYTNSLNPVTSFYTNEFWKSGYKFIYQANSVYEGCAESKLLTPKVKNQLMGEALFIRAYWHFYLVNLYGDIPLITTTDYTKNAVAARMPVSAVYEQLIKDLKMAQTLLNEDYVGADGITAFSERVRPNRTTAAALLARIYLFSGNYPEAESTATSIIENNSVYELAPINEVFLNISREAIWQLLPLENSTINTPEGNNFILTASPITQRKSTISTRLLNDFEPGDLRKTNWIGKISVGSPATNYYFANKYKVRTGSDYSEYSILFRLAEQYLIRAEARNEQNNIEGAIQDLNQIRSRARDIPTSDIPNPLPDLTTSLSREEVKIAILHERRIELFTEQGHRWFDLKRSAIVNTVMGEVSTFKGSSWSDYKRLWPIPNIETLNDPNIKQNNGYN